MSCVSLTFLWRHRQVPTVKTILTSVETPQAQFIPVVMEDRCFDSALQKTVERTQVQRTERIVDVTVVTPHEALTIMSVQKTVEVQQTQFLDRVVDLRILRDPVSGLSKDKFG